MSKKLADLKDANGTSLQSYVELLMEKANEAGANVVILVAAPPASLHLVTNVDSTVIPDVLSQLASQMRKKPVRKEVKNVNPKETQVN